MLVPLDTSEYAVCMLSHVKDIAVSRHVPEVVLLSVTELGYRQFSEYLSDEVVRQADKRAHDKAFAYLVETKHSPGLSDSKVSTVVRSGQPAEAILFYIQENGVDIVVMSSQGKSGVRVAARQRRRARRAELSCPGIHRAPTRLQSRALASHPSQHCPFLTVHRDAAVGGATAQLYHKSLTCGCRSRLPTG
jgi:nucleotide-binding universal stress UspA family protein